MDEKVVEIDLLYVLKNGILGGPLYDKLGGKTFEEKWAYGTRRRRRQHAWFNIVGRSPRKEKIPQSYWWRGDQVGITFDTSNFKEEKPGGTGERKIKTFFSAEPDMWHDWDKFFGNLQLGDERIRQHKNFIDAQRSGLINKEGKPLPSTEFGFSLFSRVAPRFFRGLVLGYKYTDEDLKKVIDQLEQVYQEKEDLLFPIYSENGNLLWPQKMSYEEVKKFVVERDARKKSKI